MEPRRNRLSIPWIVWIFIAAIGAVAGILVTKSQVDQAVPPVSNPTMPPAPATQQVTSTPAQTPTPFPTLIELTEPAIGSLPTAGGLAPDFTLGMLTAQDRLTLSQLRGKAVLLNFWASKCPPCKTESPLLERLYTANQAKGLVILGVIPGNEDTRSGAQAFAASYALSYPLLWDDKDMVTQQYGVIGLPTSVMINPDGRIDQVIIGAVTEEQVSAFIDKALPKN